MKLDKDIYTITEAAKIVGLTSDAIRYAIKTGTLKASTFGRSYIIKAQDLNKYINVRENATNEKKQASKD